MTQHYDIIVVGMQTSGVIAAGLLAKRGRRVLLLDHGEQTSSYRTKGLALPLVPTIVPTLEDSPPMRQVHDELALMPALRAKSSPVEVAFQALMPRQRIDIRTRRDALLDELRAEFPDVVDATAEALNRIFELDDIISGFLAANPPLPPATWVERWRIKKGLEKVAHLDKPFEADELLGGLPADHPVRELLLGPLYFFGHLTSDVPTTLHAVRLIARYYRGVVTFQDRLGGLAALLVKAAEQAGVEVKRNAVVRSITPAKRKLVELELEDGRHSLTADFFIHNTLRPFEELIPTAKQHPRFLLERQAVRQAGSLLVVNLVVRREVIPLGMATSAFVLNGRRRARDEAPSDPPLFVCRYPAQRFDAHGKIGATLVDDPQHEVLSVACPVRTAEVAHSPERFNAYKTQMVARIERVVPFLKEHLVDTSLPVDTTSWDVDSETMRHMDPWSIYPLYETSSPPFLGVAARAIRGYYSNLIYCGRDVVPGLGLEGEYVTGLGAAATVQKVGKSLWKDARD